MSYDETAVLLKEGNAPKPDPGNAPTLFDLAKQGLLEAIAYEKGEIPAKATKKVKDDG